MDPYRVIQAPVITEKSLAQEESNCYSFWVDWRASKSQIKEAFKIIFGVEPQKVRTLVLKGKRRHDWRHGRLIFKPKRKKAIIQLPEGAKIKLLAVKKKSK